MSKYFYDKTEDIPKNESLNKYQYIFQEYIKKIPTLIEALNQMFSSTGISEQKIKDLTEDIVSKSQKIINFNFCDIKDKHPTIEREEALIISSYTCKAFDSNYSPYKILNWNLNDENRERGIKNISKYLFIFLKALRKLERYYPQQKYMYRCIDKYVNLKEDFFNKKIIHYHKGIKKVFYGFTSISSKMDKTYNLNGKKKEFEKGTFFNMYGNYFGYDISFFNKLMEEEIILEPELKFLVENAVCPSKKNNFIHIKCKFEEPSKVLENIIGPDNIKLVYKISDEYIKYIYFKFYNKFNPIKENKNIKIFGSKFIKNIIDKCKYIYKGKNMNYKIFWIFQI